MFCVCYKSVFGSIEGSNDDGLEMEELRQLDDILNALIDLSQAEISVAVDIE